MVGRLKRLEGPLAAHPSKRLAVGCRKAWKLAYPGAPRSRELVRPLASGSRRGAESAPGQLEILVGEVPSGDP
jgi:hypothetical protein